MAFDAVDFKDVKVTAAGKPLPFEYTGRQIKIHWPKPVRRGTRVEVAIHYRVTEPKLGLHFVGPDRHYPAKPLQAWTQGEDEYNRYWFPCHDAPQERATTEMIVTVADRFTAISNGALLRVPASGTDQNVPLEAERAAASLSRVFGRGRIQRNQGPLEPRARPLLLFSRPRRRYRPRAFGKTPKMIEFFSKKLGVPYAYAKYSQVAAVDFIYGGMENTSCTTQTALTLHDERAHLDFSSDPLVAHELAHQWFGDLVTCKDWSHAWLNESFRHLFRSAL